MLHGCLGACPRPPHPCLARCAHRARELYARCLERLADEVRACVEEGGDEETCRARAIRRCRAHVNEFLARCSRHCRDGGDDGGDGGDPPSCRERCGLAAETLREECAAEGGSDTECAAAVEAFLARCAERCDDPEPPDPCDFDCEAGAARLQARCEKEQDPAAEPRDCAALAAEFLEACRARQDAHCDQETLALTFAPRDFERGDVNEDGTRDISDAVSELNALFLGSGEIPCLDAADVNDDGATDLSDPVYNLNNLFLGGPRPPPPAGARGVDETPDSLWCD
jgi:hypothetical protein